MQIFPNATAGLANVHFDTPCEAVGLAHNGLKNSSIWGWSIVFKSAFIYKHTDQPKIEGIGNNELHGALAKLLNEADTWEGTEPAYRDPTRSPSRMRQTAASIWEYLHGQIAEKRWVPDGGSLTPHVPASIDVVDEHIIGLDSV